MDVVAWKSTVGKHHHNLYYYYISLLFIIIIIITIYIINIRDGDAGQPIVFHGRTLTGKILFKDVIKAINDYAFEASPYPVIISLENHCSKEQQYLIAKFLKVIFKSTLYIPGAYDYMYMNVCLWIDVMMIIIS